MSLAQAIAQSVGALLPGEVALVADPDELLRGQPAQSLLTQRGSSVLFAEDPVDLRLAWEQRDLTDSVVVAASSSAKVRGLPADIRAATVRQLELDSRALLKPLMFDVTVGLSWDELSSAYDLAQTLGAVQKVDRETTLSRLLRQLYKLDPQTMGQPDELLAGLLRLHRVPRAEPISARLRDEFAIRVGDLLPGIPTARALQDRRAFLDWLAQLWGDVVAEQDHEWRPMLTRPPVSDLLDEFFEDGSLAPISVTDGAGIPFGVVRTPESAQRQVDRQLEDVADEFEAGHSDYQRWRIIARLFAQATATQMSAGEPTDPFVELRTALNRNFVPWVLHNFASLASLPAVPSPVLVHRAGRCIQMSRGGGRAALVVMDGMSLAAWQLLAPRLAELDAQVSDGAAFAWIPTLTTISRQAIFAGTLPLHFADSLGSTAKEADQWRALWRNEANLDTSAVGYGKFRLADFRSSSDLHKALLSSGLGREVLGLAVEDIDLLVHAQPFDERAMYATLNDWAERSVFLWLLKDLLDEGYRVFVTSDHGFIRAEPIGASRAGATAAKHGRFERFSDPVLAAAAAAKDPSEPWRRWTGHGLPADWHIVFAPLFGMYFQDRHIRLTHGGPTMEEVVVPWVEIHR